MNHGLLPLPDSVVALIIVNSCAIAKDRLLIAAYEGRNESVKLLLAEGAVNGSSW